MGLFDKLLQRGANAVGTSLTVGRATAQGSSLARTTATPFGALRAEDLVKSGSGIVNVNPRTEKIHSVIDCGMCFNGDLEANAGVKIDGRVFGNVLFGLQDGMLVLSRQGVISGNVKGPRALIMGEVEGDIHIPGVLLLSPTARVRGNITCGHLISFKGCQYEGSVRIMPQLLNEVPVQKGAAPQLVGS